MISAIDKISKDVRIEIIKDRSFETVQDFIKRNIENGNTVMTDGYAFYTESIKSINGKHFLINLESELNGKNTDIMEN